MAHEQGHNHLKLLLVMPGRWKITPYLRHPPGWLYHHRAANHSSHQPIKFCYTQYALILPLEISITINTLEKEIIQLVQFIIV